jgi:hypothetical protein
MAAAQQKTQLDRIMTTVSRKKCKKSRRVLKTRSAIQLQNWWRGIRRRDMRKLCEQTLTRDMHRGTDFPCSITPSWKFLKSENISAASAATLHFMTWDHGWTHRAGPWRFYSSYHILRSKNEPRYLIADLVWRSVPPSKAPKRDGAESDILYDPVLRQFILEERETWGMERVTVFETIRDVLIYVRYKNEHERLRMRSRSASLIQYVWREAHGYKYVRPRAFGEQTDSDDSCSDSE